MKRFLKNKYVILTIIIVVLIIAYFTVNKAIKQYNYTNDDDIVAEENVEEYSDEENNFALENDFAEAEDNVGNLVENVEDNENGGDDMNSGSKIYVYITGEVNVPGVVILNENSRIIDAIDAAGGTTSKANISKVNLAYVLKDGMKVNIPSDSDLRNNSDFEYITMNSVDGKNDDASGMTSSSTLSGGNSENGESVSNASASNSSHRNELVNINTATQTELETLPGIGPSIALKIINYRNENGRFSSVEDIKNVNRNWGQ